MPRERSFFLVAAAGLISWSGDFVLAVGLPFYAFRLTGSALATGLILAAAFVPGIVLGSIAGVFVDRWPRRRTLVVTNVILAAALLPLLLVDSAERIWIVYLVAFVESSVAQFFHPAFGTFLSTLVPADGLASANAVLGTVRQLARLGGSGAGGIVLALWSVTGLVLVDAASFLVAAILFLLVRGREAALQHVAVAAVAGAWERFMREWVAGLRQAWREHATRVLVLFAVISGVGEGIVGALFAPFFSSAVGGDAAAYGLFIGTQAVGGIIGGLAVARLGRRSDPAMLLGVAAVLFGVIDFALFTYPLYVRELWPAFAFIALVGFPGAAAVAGYSTLQQTAGEDRYRGRLLGAFGATASAAGLGGCLAAGALADRVGIIPVIAVDGILYVVAGAIVLASLAALARRTPREIAA